MMAVGHLEYLDLCLNGIFKLAAVNFVRDCT